MKRSNTYVSLLDYCDPPPTSKKPKKETEPTPDICISYFCEKYVPLAPRDAKWLDRKKKFVPLKPHQVKQEPEDY